MFPPGKIASAGLSTSRRLAGLRVFRPTYCELAALKSLALPEPDRRDAQRDFRSGSVRRICCRVNSRFFRSGIG